MIETHPFGAFVPPKAKYLILGSFIAKKNDEDTTYDWFYGAKRNQFWKILRGVYDLELNNKTQKQKLLTKLKVAITDIIYQCERENGSSLDNNLINIVYNIKSIDEILQNNRIEKVYFTSRFVEKSFRKKFRDVITRYSATDYTNLPSPSPRYATMTLAEKIIKYKILLPLIY